MLAHAWQTNNQSNQNLWSRRKVRAATEGGAIAGDAAEGEARANQHQPCRSRKRPRPRRHRWIRKFNLRRPLQSPPRLRSARRLRKSGRLSNRSNRRWSRWKKCSNWSKWLNARKPPTSTRSPRCAARCTSCSRRTASGANPAVEFATNASQLVRASFPFGKSNP